jgi:uracil-DNA glycosylase
MTILRPALVITLGKSAYERLRFSENSYEDNLCTLQSSKNLMLFTEFGYHFSLLPWPHPSGLNRWHNSEENRMRLEATFPLVQPYIRGAV